MTSPANPALDATRPAANATVHASAGTGKTWLLVTRLVRLLLAGVEPGRVLAVTFTRKAAAEMLERLTERLRLLATVPDADLDPLLEQMGVAPEPELRRQARRLYETLLRADFNLRATTFHSVCQEILQRFPLEAGVPPGFELLEAEGDARDAAWDALYAEATAAPEGDIGRALDTLMDGCGGLGSVQTALGSFLAHRIDWWAYTDGRDDPVAWAGERLREQLDIDPDTDPERIFFNDLTCQRLQNFRDLLLLHPTDTHSRQAAAIAAALNTGTPAPARIEALWPALLTQKGEPLSRKASKTLEKKLGADGMERLLGLHAQLCEQFLDLLDARQRRTNWELNRAWYHAGARLLEQFQAIKRNQRQLDFSDLEWHAYQLLNRSEQAHWVQYKLDNRIDHLLVDEFQDTNPTQWRLLLPLLEELAAGSERPRSVFLVGDEKQSIYRFRRADSRLLGAASEWLEQHLASRRHSLTHSRRSAAAIIDCVNRVFAQPELHSRMPHFEPHGTFHPHLWGRVELLPLIQAEAAPEAEPVPAPTGLRDPLRLPRELPLDDRYYREGRQAAERIQALIAGGCILEEGDRARPVRYGDILILLRSRTHAADYERALRDAGIPCLGTSRGALLDSLEARDLEALLQTLIAPHNNLALAQVLRSPLFAATDADLVCLAGLKQGDWMARLAALADAAATPESLRRAADCLPRWGEQVGRLPVHDLLDRIFFEGDVLARYAAATPAALRPQVLANLQRFLELALEIDSGRYPSLPRFLQQLSRLRERTDEAPDDAPPAAGDRVRMLTIHGAKGLEAPVVLLLDAAAAERDRSAWQALVDWPASDARPRYFLLNPGQARRDRISRDWQAAQQQAEAREDANLLYVALTRARQLLIVSGTAPARGSGSGWHGLIRTGLAPETEALDTPLVLESGVAPAAAASVATPAAAEAPAPDPRLTRPLEFALPRDRLAPSRRNETIADSEGFDADGRLRGQAVHLLLEWLSAPAPISAGVALQRLAAWAGRDAMQDDLQAWLAEARALLAHPGLADLFDPTRYETAWKEVPLQYLDDGVLVEGIVDRLVRHADRLLLIDYKTHRLGTAPAAQHAASFQGQMRYYAAGARRLWPQLPIECGILYTHSRELVLLDIH